MAEPLRLIRTQVPAVTSLGAPGFPTPGRQIACIKAVLGRNLSRPG